jgi:uncharacterized beta-barrel protein YwiB (DUF1934 family)
MTVSRRVQLQIISKSGDQHIEQNFQAELYVKGTHIYYRYNEVDENMGRTITTLKVEPQQIRIIRHGDIQSEQTFVPQSNRAGSYQTPQGTLELATFTHDISTNLTDQLGDISWSYDLLVSGEQAGTYYLTAKISELGKPLE